MVYRAAGWRGVYVPTILAMGCTPTDWASYLRQQLRWSRALIDLRLRVFPQLAARLSMVERTLNLLHGVYYLRALVVPVGYVLLAQLILRNVAPPFMHGRPMLWMTGLLLLLAGIDGFRKRYFLDPATESGILWRATVMQFAKWPAFVRALVQAIRGRQVAYLLTAKGQKVQRTRALAPVQLGVAIGMGATLLVGTMLHGQLQRPLVLWGAAVIVLCSAIAVSDVRRPIARFDPTLYAARVRAHAAAARDAAA